MLLYPVFALIKLFHIHSSTYYNKQNVIVPCLRSYQAFSTYIVVLIITSKMLLYPVFALIKLFPHT